MPSLRRLRGRRPRSSTRACQHRPPHRSLADPRNQQTQGQHRSLNQHMLGQRRPRHRRVSQIGLPARCGRASRSRGSWDGRTSGPAAPHSLVNTRRSAQRARQLTTDAGAQHCNIATSQRVQAGRARAYRDGEELGVAVVALVAAELGPVRVEHDLVLAGPEGADAVALVAVPTRTQQSQTLAQARWRVRCSRQVLSMLTPDLTRAARAATRPRAAARAGNGQPVAGVEVEHEEELSLLRHNQLVALHTHNPRPRVSLTAGLHPDTRTAQGQDEPSARRQRAIRSRSFLSRLWDLRDIRGRDTSFLRDTNSWAPS